MENRFLIPVLAVVAGLCSTTTAYAERTPYSDAIRAAEHLAAKRGDGHYDPRAASATRGPAIPGSPSVAVKEFVFHEPLTEYEAVSYANLHDLTLVEIGLRRALPLTGQIQTGRVYRLHEKNVQTFASLNESTAAFYMKFGEQRFAESVGNPELQGKSGAQPAKGTGGDIYTVRFAGAPAALTGAARSLPAEVFDVSLREEELAEIEAAIAVYTTNQIRTHCPLRPFSTGIPANQPGISARQYGSPNRPRCEEPPRPSPPPPPPPPPPPAPQTVAEYDLDKPMSNEVQAPGNLPGPAGTVSSVGRILLCGIDPATNDSYRINTTYGRTETEGNCPSDVTWAPEPEFGFGADNGFDGLIQVISQDDNDPDTPPINYMVGSVGTALRWGTFLLETFNPETGVFSYFWANTMAFDNIRPRCDPTVVASLTAPCGGTGSSRQTGVIGVPEATYEDEIVLPNDFCTFFNGDACFEVDFIFTNLPCGYGDTPFLDDNFTPTAGSACAINILRGVNYSSSFSFSNQEGIDLSILTRDTKHNGQVGTERNLPLPVALRVFAVDTRTLSDDRFVPLPF